MVTGANSGIGKATATALVGAGAHVVMTARDMVKGEAAAQEIRAGAGRGTVEVMALDLSLLASVRAFAGDLLDRHDRLDVLILNAGGTTARRNVTEDGLESMFQVNHLGHFLLANLLRDRLISSAPARVVVVASIAHRRAGALDFDDLQSERTFSPMLAYARSKLANILFTRELARRLAGTGVTVNALHPGTVRTGWGADGDAGLLLSVGLRTASWVFLSPEQGARTSVYLATAPEVEDVTGDYFVRCRRRRPAPAAHDDGASARLWQASMELAGLTEED